MTAQVRDILIYKNEEFQLACEPLKEYLKTEELPFKLVSPHTACWRGYQAKWSIVDDKLYLIEWKGYILDYMQIGMGYLFPDKETVFAEWFTGEIKIGMGDGVLYVHGGYDSIYEGEMTLIFYKGKLVDESTKWLTQEEIDEILRKDDERPF